MQEEWRGMIYAGEDYSEWLEVSNLGRFRNPKTRTIRKQNLNHNGYYFISFSMGSRSAKKTIRCHKAIAETWVPNPENKPIVNHIDGIKTHNSLDNLEWATSRENTEHAITLGLFNLTAGPIRQKEIHNRKLKAINNKTDEVFYFDSQDDAAEYLTSESLATAKLTHIRGSINRACNAKRKSYLGFKWEYQE